MVLVISAYIAKVMEKYNQRKVNVYHDIWWKWCLSDLYCNQIRKSQCTHNCSRCVLNILLLPKMIGMDTFEIRKTWVQFAIRSVLWVSLVVREGLAHGCGVNAAKERSNILVVSRWNGSIDSKRKFIGWRTFSVLTKKRKLPEKILVLCIYMSFVEESHS